VQDGVLTPPMYWSISNNSDLGGVERHGAVVRVAVAVEIQDESMKVSMVSVSRRAAPPHFGHATSTNSGTFREANGRRR